MHFRAASRQAHAAAKIGYREPVKNGFLGFNLAFATEETFWEHFTNTEAGNRFARAMRAFEKATAEVIPIVFPFNKMIADGGLIVDVGGGLGLLATNILCRYPDIGLRCVVQDKFADPNHAFIHKDLEMQVHDFFEPQPIKGKSADCFLFW